MENEKYIPCIGVGCKYDKSTCPRHKKFVDLIDGQLKSLREKLMNGEFSFELFQMIIIGHCYNNGYPTEDQLKCPKAPKPRIKVNRGPQCGSQCF